MPSSELKPLVLVVDDEINTTIMLQYIFEREGYRVERATDGISGIEIAQQRAPDLILLDILLPKMNGFEVLAILKSDERTKNIPTILITANAREPADVAHGMTLGADDYLYKPFAPQELLARAQSKMRAYRLEKALRTRTQELEFLLETSEKLNQYLQIDDLINVIAESTADIFSAQQVQIVLLDKSRTVYHSHTLERTSLDITTPQTLTAICLQHFAPSRLWHAGDIAELHSGGMFTSIQNNDQRLGLLIVLHNTGEYTENQLRLLEGISRQMAMALRNAELYELQSVYAQSLEATIKQRSEELVSAHRLLIRNDKLASIGHLAASIAHEINNPLMPVGLLLESMEDTLRTLPNTAIDLQDIGIVRENVQRIQRIVRSLLDFSRPDGALRDLDVSMVLQGVIKLNTHHFEIEQMHIAAKVKPQLMVHGSKDHLEAVFMNLTLNARAAMMRGGTLQIVADHEGDDIVIQFIDSGSGIRPEDIDKIFDPFYSTKQNGTGLGLFICYSVITGHQGKIEVKSKVGEGTIFIIRLPCVL